MISLLTFCFNIQKKFLELQRSISICNDETIVIVVRGFHRERVRRMQILRARLIRGDLITARGRHWESVLRISIRISLLVRA